LATKLQTALTTEWKVSIKFRKLGLRSAKFHISFESGKWKSFAKICRTVNKVSKRMSVYLSTATKKKTILFILIKKSLFMWLCVLLLRAVCLFKFFLFQPFRVNFNLSFFLFIFFVFALILYYDRRNIK
jgi:hypothetical protein